MIRLAAGGEVVIDTPGRTDEGVGAIRTRTELVLIIVVLLADVYMISEILASPA